MKSKVINIVYHKISKILDLYFDTNQMFALSAEFLRVHSPSAEVRGHGSGQEVLQLNKNDINITKIEPVGNYAIKIIFSDNHNTGIYSWDYLYEISKNKDSLWQDYLKNVENYKIRNK